MILDNAPTHPKASELNAIDPRCQVKYLPPNVTSVIQPMDQGVISAMKRHYKTGLLRELLSSDTFANGDVVLFLKKWTVLDCMKILKEAWDILTPTTIGNAWNKILPNIKKNVQNISVTNNEIVQLLNRIPAAKPCSSSDVEEWLQEDNDLQTCHLLSDEEILNSCAGLQLPLPVETEDTHNDVTDEEDNDVGVLGCQTLPEIFQAAQALLNWTRQEDAVSNEDIASIRRVRDVILSRVTERTTV